MRRMNILAGAICVFAGAMFGAMALNLPAGSLSRMGPGFLPLATAVGLICVGVAIALFDRDETGLALPEEIRAQLRPLLAVLAAIALFALGIDRLGLMPTSALATFTASFAMRRISLVSRIVLSLVVMVICTAIFHFGLRLSVSLVGG